MSVGKRFFMGGQFETFIKAEKLVSESPRSESWLCHLLCDQSYPGLKYLPL